MTKRIQLIAAALITCNLFGCGGTPEPTDVEGSVGQSQQALLPETGGKIFLKLCVSASDASNAGTSNDIELQYTTTNDEVWTCNVDSVPEGGESCCTPSLSYRNATGDYDHFYVGYRYFSQSSDGLRVGKLSFTLNDWTKYSIDRFMTGDMNLHFAGCSYNILNGCSSFWIDSDGSKPCTRAKVKVSGITDTWCWDYI